MNQNSVFKIVCRFLSEIFYATLLFAGVALPAVVLNIMIKYLEHWGIDPNIISVLKVIEWSIFIADGMLFLVFLTRSTIDLARTIWKH